MISFDDNKRGKASEAIYRVCLARPSAHLKHLNADQEPAFKDLCEEAIDAIIQAMIEYRYTK